MTKEEFNIFAKIMRTAFTKEKILPNTEAMELWYKMLQDIPYNLAEAFLEKWISQNQWSPTIADIRQGCATIATAEIPDWGEAWAEVKHAISRWGWMNEQKAYESMSPLTEKTVRYLGGFYALCTSEGSDETMRAQFRDVYTTVAKREKEDRQLPKALKETISLMKLFDWNRKELSDGGESRLETGTQVPQQGSVFQR